MIVELLIRLALALGGVIALTVLYYTVMGITQSKSANTISGDSTPREAKGDSADAEKVVARDRAPDASFRAVIACSSIPPATVARYQTCGYIECQAQNLVFGGKSACEHGCLGLGSCARACPCDAILIRQNTIYVSTDCTGCGRCVPVCPKGLISLKESDKLTPLPCAASSISPESICPSVATPIDYAKIPDSFFKRIARWVILSKSRGTSD